MKRLKQIIGDGLALAIPLVVIFYVLHKAHQVLKQGIGPLAEKWGIHELFGKLTLSILAILVMVAIVLFMGLLMQFAIVNRLRNEVEKVVLKFFPSLKQVNALVADKLDLEGASSSWKPVVLSTEEEIHLAFLVEEKDGIGVFYVVKGRNVKEVELLILESRRYTWKPVEAHLMRKVLGQFGVGAPDLIRSVMKG
jgi:uncharacterized membrane protein